MTTAFVQILSSVCIACVLNACTTAPSQHRIEDRIAGSPASGKAAANPAAGRVITMGMPGTGVIDVLGTPNVMTANAEQNEVWVWNQSSTSVAYTRSKGTITGLTVAESTDDANQSTRRGSSSALPGNLTIVIEFDANMRVANILAFRDSSF